MDAVFLDHMSDVLPAGRPNALIRSEDFLLLRAISTTGPACVRAFEAWRENVRLDDIEGGAYRIVPLLVRLVRREGIRDSDLERLKGIERHIWAANTLKLNQLFVALDAIQASGSRALLLKGAALIARTPEAAARRVVGDYDVLVEPEKIGDVRAQLVARGFSPFPGYDFAHLDDGLQQSPTAGIPIQLAGSANEIDLHWRALPAIHDPALTAELFVGAETRTVQGRPVQVPGMAHHLFTSIARCESWDHAEVLSRLNEGYFLLSDRSATIDWSLLHKLLHRYGLEAVAAAYFEVLRGGCGLEFPRSITNPGKTPSFRFSQLELGIRSRDPGDRTPLQDWFLGNWAHNRHRNEPGRKPASLSIAALRALGFGGAAIGGIWRATARRYRMPPKAHPRFLDGFSWPEAAGTWTNATLAAMSVPLTPEQAAGAPVRINATAFPAAMRSRIVASGGARPLRIVQPAHRGDLELSLVVRPLETLGGNGLIVFHLPDACSPHSQGHSADTRRLALHIARDWQIT